MFSDLWSPGFNNTCNLILVIEDMMNVPKYDDKNEIMCVINEVALEIQNNNYLEFEKIAK